MLSRKPPRADDGVSLRDYFDVRHDALVEVVTSHFIANTAAVTLARDELDRRLAEMNNLRAQIYNDANTYVRQEKLDTIIAGLRDSMDGLEKSTRLLSDAQLAAWQAALQAAATSASVRIGELEKYRATADGRAALLQQLIFLVPLGVGILEFVIIKFVK